MLDGYHQKMVFMAFLNEGMNAPFSHTIHSLHTLHVEMQSSSFWRKCPRQLNSIKQKNRRVLINEIQIMMMWNPKLKSVQIDHDDNDAKSDLEKRRDLQQLMPIPTVLRPTVKISQVLLKIIFLIRFALVIMIMIMIINPAPPVEVGSCSGAAGIEDDGKVNLSGRWRWAKSWNYQDGHKDDIKFNLFLRQLVNRICNRISWLWRPLSFSRSKKDPTK